MYLLYRIISRNCIPFFMSMRIASRSLETPKRYNAPVSTLYLRTLRNLDKAIVVWCQPGKWWLNPST